MTRRRGREDPDWVPDMEEDPEWVPDTEEDGEDDKVKLQTRSTT